MPIVEVDFKYIKSNAKAVLSTLLLLLSVAYRLDSNLCKHNICLHFGIQDGQDGKKTERKSYTKVTKIPKTKRQKYGMNNTFVFLLVFGIPFCDIR